MSCTALLLACVFLLEFGPQGGGPGGGGPVPCTCLMSNGTLSCLSEFGTRPPGQPDTVNCGAQICQATLPPTCPINATIRWTNPIDATSWIVESPKFTVPPLGSVGQMRTPVGVQVCTYDSFCSGCQFNPQMSPQGEYCLKQTVAKQTYPLYALCLDGAGQPQPCEGN